MHEENEPVGFFKIPQKIKDENAREDRMREEEESRKVLFLQTVANMLANNPSFNAFIDEKVQRILNHNEDIFSCIENMILYGGGRENGHRFRTWDKNMIVDLNLGGSKNGET